MDKISAFLWTAVITLLCVEKTLCTPRDGGVNPLKKKASLESRGGIQVNLIELRGQSAPCHEEGEIFGTQLGRNCWQNSTSQSFYGPGNYLMQISLGTPPQKFSMILDTRSDLVWVQCRPCTTCSTSIQSIFDPSLSSTFSNVSCDDRRCSSVPNTGCASETCSYQNKNDDNQLVAEGKLFEDTLSVLAAGVTNLKVDQFGFGCSEQNIGLQALQVDGIAGMGRGPVSLISQVGDVYGASFSYCLTRSVPNNGMFNRVGPSKLTLGDDAVPSKADQKAKKIQWAPILKNEYNPSFYLLNLQGIAVNGKKIKVPSPGFKVEKGGKGGTILDFGVKNSKLSQPIYDSLIQALEPLIEYKKVSEVFTRFKECYAVPGPDEPKLPTITLHFQGASLTLPGDKSFIEVQSTSGQNAGRVMCLAVDATDDDFNVLGSVWQHTVEIIVDNDAGNRHNPPRKKLY
ncbi:hypothetical protein R1sor_008278 [Riccia sorocarpa]|uniref:Peptidase A1 domain-containing protein n=1 Tax=Riccia sorocarpa TaxID=122646 RepID=A0ABD3HVS7_9MARC